MSTQLPVFLVCGWEAKEKDEKNKNILTKELLCLSLLKKKKNSKIFNFQNILS